MTDDSDDEGHGEDEEHVCEACGKSFDSEAALERHIKEVGLVE